MSHSTSTSSLPYKLYFSRFPDGTKLKFNNNGNVYHGTVLDDRVYVSADRNRVEHVTLVQSNSITIDLYFRVYASNLKRVALGNKNIKDIKVLT